MPRPNASSRTGKLVLQHSHGRYASHLCAGRKQNSMHRRNVRKTKQVPMYESWREHTTSSSVNFSACTPHSMGTSNAVCTGPKWTSFRFAAFIQLPVWETTPLPFRCFIQNGKTFNKCTSLSVVLTPCLNTRKQCHAVLSQTWVFFRAAIQHG